MKQYIYALITHKDRILMLQRPQHKRTNAGCWNLAGGKIEEGESDANCVQREVSEETGLLFQPRKKILDRIYQATEPIRVAVFEGDTDIQDSDGKIRIRLEHEAYGWFTFDQARELEVMPYIKDLLESR